MSIKKIVHIIIITFLFFPTLIIMPYNTIKANGVDVTPPVIISVNINKYTARPGDTIIAVVKATDSESGFTDKSPVAQSSICYNNIANVNINITSGSFVYNPSTNEFVFNSVVPDNVRNGKYRVRVSIADRMGNTTTREYDDKIVTIVGGYDDYVPPLIESFAMSKSNVKPGDTVKITLKAKDSGSGLPNLLIPTLLDFVDDAHPETQSKICGIAGDVMLLYISNGIYEGSFVVSEEAWNGTYTPRVQICDIAENANVKYLSNYKLIVTGGKSPSFPPKLESIEFSSTVLYPKDTLKISIKTADYLFDYNDIVIDAMFDCITYPNFHNNDLTQGVRLKYDTSSNKYIGYFKVPVAIPEAEYYASVVLFDKNHNYISKNFRDDIFKVKSLISYEKKAVPINGEFDPLKSVVARSPYEGDITDKIKFIGEIDTSTPGLNLYKYEVTGKDGDIYEDFRWVMVSDNYYSIVNGVLSTNNNLAINVSDETKESVIVIAPNASILADTKDITLKDSGIYTIKIVEASPLLSSNKSFIHMNISMNFIMPVFGSSSNKSDNDYLNLTVHIDRDPPRIYGVNNNKSIRGTVTPTTEEPCTATLNGKFFKLGSKIIIPGKYLLKVTDRAGNISTVNFIILGANNAAANGVASNASDSIEIESSTANDSDVLNSNYSSIGNNNDIGGGKSASIISTDNKFLIDVWFIIIPFIGIAVIGVLILHRRLKKSNRPSLE